MGSTSTRPFAEPMTVVPSLPNEQKQIDDLRLAYTTALLGAEQHRQLRQAKQDKQDKLDFMKLLPSRGYWEWMERCHTNGTTVWQIGFNPVPIHEFRWSRSQQPIKPNEGDIPRQNMRRMLERGRNLSKLLQDINLSQDCAWMICSFDAELDLFRAENR